MQRARAHLLRELAPRHAGAAGVRDRRTRSAASGTATACGGSPPPTRRPATARAARRRRRTTTAPSRRPRRSPRSRSRPKRPSRWRGSSGTTTATRRSGDPTASATRSTSPSNPDWYDPDYIGIDQGPIVLMIENYRTGSVWNRFMRNADVRRGLAARRLPCPPVASVPEPAVAATCMLAAEPNPFTDATTLRFRLAAAAPRDAHGARPRGPRSRAGWWTASAPPGSTRASLSGARPGERSLLLPASRAAASGSVGKCVLLR